MLIIGSHVGFNSKTQLLGSVNEALSYGSNAFMFYTGAPQNTKRNPINDLLTYQAMDVMKKNNINIKNVIVHAPYIINLANNSDLSKYEFSIDFLKQECERCDNLFIDKLVLHPGSHVGIGVDIGIENIINALNIVLKDTQTTILLETMAGKGTEIGRNFDELKRIIDGVLYKDKIGICLDTCHLHDASYDVSNFSSILDELEKLNLLDKIKCIHINDSKNIRGSKKDRHENIGYGNIGFDNLIKIIYDERLKDIPHILETPYINDLPPYKYEIDMIKEKKFNPNLKN